MAEADVIEKRRRAIASRNEAEERKKYLDKCLTISFNIGPVHFYINPLVTAVSALIIWSFVAWCIADPNGSLREIAKWKEWITDKWTWLYVGTQDVWAVFIIILYFSKYSKMKLGKEDEKPEFTDGTYFTMLFAAGIGIGLFYFGVAEPIYHLEPGPYGNRWWGRYTDNERAQDAINVTFFHWGVHGWIVYVMIGLLLGFLCHRKGLPMTMRTCFYPLLGDKVFGIMGDVIDILSVICTMFGVCTSLGLGVIQVNQGVNRLNENIAVSTTNQIIIIWLITAVATASVVSGLKLGIRRLSELCFVVGCFIMFIVFFADNTWYILNLYVQSLGYYMQWLVQIGFHTDAFAQLGNAPDKKENPNWMDGWTIFYWGWWISWAPFVGMFIAKISRGRTIRDFITYTMTIPMLYTFFWLTIFGGAGILMERRAQNLNITCDMYKVPTGLNISSNKWAAQIFSTYGVHKLSCRPSTDMWFDVVEQYGDLGTFLSVLSLTGIVLYFVTSSDSGSLVIDCLSANGHPDPPLIQRLFWALTEGACATALLKAGGKDALTALQTASITAGLPYTFILNFACVAMWRIVREESGEVDPDEGRWRMTIWDINSLDRFGGVVVNAFFPWLSLAKTATRLSSDPSPRTMIVNAIVYATPFYLWIALMLAEIQVKAISYVGWAILVGWFAYAGGLRTTVRERHGLQGNMIEDFFAMSLLYPLAIAQMEEQVFRDPLTVSPTSDIELEVGGMIGKQLEADGYGRVPDADV